MFEVNDQTCRKTFPERPLEDIVSVSRKKIYEKYKRNVWYIGQ